MMQMAGLWAPQCKDHPFSKLKSFSTYAQTSVWGNRGTGFLPSWSQGELAELSCWDPNLCPGMRKSPPEKVCTFPVPGSPPVNFSWMWVTEKDVELTGALSSTPAPLSSVPALVLIAALPLPVPRTLSSWPRLFSLLLFLLFSASGTDSFFLCASWSSFILFIPTVFSRICLYP